MLNYYNNRDAEKGFEVYNLTVVPNNSYFLKKYKCHINLEYCRSIERIKYIHNCLHSAFCIMKQVTDKGVDTKTTDKISTFIDGRCISVMEEAWRLQEFPIFFGVILYLVSSSH